MGNRVKRDRSFSYLTLKLSLNFAAFCISCFLQLLRVSQRKPNKFFISGTHNESDFGMNQQQQPTIFVNEDPDIDQIRIGTPPAIIELE